MEVGIGRVVVGREDGRSVSLGGVGVVYKISGEETGGAFSVVEHPVAPGTLVPPHVHTREDEYSYVLEGDIGVRVGDREATASPGSYVFKPRGVRHTFWNSGPEPGRLIEIISPAGFEQYFEEMAALFVNGGPPDFEAVTELAGRYGCSFHMEWVPDLAARHNVSLLTG